MDKLFSVSDAAKALGGISPWTVRAWLSRGWLQRTKLGRRTMITEPELERFVRDGRGPIARQPNEARTNDETLEKTATKRPHQVTNSGKGNR